MKDSIVVCISFDRTKIQILVKKIIEFQEKHNVFNYGTQIIMNLCCNKLIYVDQSWNDQKRYYDYKQGKLPKIIHWYGGKKPWSSEEPDDIWHQYYMEYLEYSKNKNNKNNMVVHEFSF
jgi:lipopolysaccharide biosynthesis glycosyltransferase